MKTAYSVLEKNSFRTFILFFSYFALFFIFSLVLRILINDDYVFIFVLLFAVIYSFFSLALGTKISLYLFGAKEIKKEDMPEVYNLVENVSIIAGLPKTPKVYIIDTNEMNAFAMGTHYSNYLVALTTGLIKKLDKKELEAVIAHEIAHIKNKDTRLMTIAIFLGGVLSIAAEIFLRASGKVSRSSRKGGSIAAILFLAGILFIILSPIFATLIQLAISRKREFMADATSALLTRNPLALASALEKISKSSQEFFDDYPNYASVFIYNPFEKKKSLLSKIKNVFSTHPPVEERIKILREMVI
jgi:heat shock protein HtpX